MKKHSSNIYSGLSFSISMVLASKSHTWCRNGAINVAGEGVESC